MKEETKVQHATQAERGSKRDLGALLHEVSKPTGPVNLPSFAVADLPTASDYEGQLVYCSDGAAGDPCLAFSDGTNWKQANAPTSNVAAS